MHLNSKLIFEKYAKSYFKNHMRVLEIGPDDYPSTYNMVVADDSITWETMDIYDNGRVTYLAKDECRFPIRDDTFDLIISGQVLEHVRKPWAWVKETARICKPGGYVITIAPIAWPYHRNPIDCWRIYPDGMASLYDEAGLEMLFAKSETLDTSYDLIRPSPILLKDKINGVIKRVFINLLHLPIIWPFDTIAIGRKAKRSDADIESKN